MADEEKKKVSEAQKRATAKYKKDNYDRIEIFARKELSLKKRIEAHCLEYGYTDSACFYKKKTTNRAAFVIKAIETQMAIDRGEIKIVKADEK